jgi:hypothetical protein
LEPAETLELSNARTLPIAHTIGVINLRWFHLLRHDELHLHGQRARKLEEARFV